MRLHLTVVWRFVFTKDTDGYIGGSLGTATSYHAGQAKV
jgi:hypothetical protein